MADMEQCNQAGLEFFEEVKVPIKYVILRVLCVQWF